MDKISIALCTYNGAKFLDEQLASFSRQARPPDELIVCDDRSTDATVEIAERYASAAAFPVKIYVNETNLGSTKNFEQAISFCTGNLIFLSDQDDVWLPPKLERFVAEFEKSANVGMLFSDAALVGENLEPLGRRLWDFSFPAWRQQEAENEGLFAVLLKGNVVTGATLAFRAQFRELVLPFPEDIPNTIHDAWITLVLAANTEVGFIKEPLIYYRQHAAQQIGVDWKYKSKLQGITRQERFAVGIGEQDTERARISKIAEVVSTKPQFQKGNAAALLASINDGLLEENAEKKRHFEARNNLPSNRLRRVAPIIRELRTNRYRRFSKGFISAAKDLLESW